MKFVQISMIVVAAQAASSSVSGVAGDLALDGTGEYFTCDNYDTCVSNVGSGSCCIETDTANSNTQGKCTVIEGGISSMTCYQQPPPSQEESAMKLTLATIGAATLLSYL